MPIKSTKLQIIKPFSVPDMEVSVTWDILGKILNDLNYAASKMANYVVQAQYHVEFLKKQYRDEHGENAPRDTFKHIDYCYPKMREMFPAIPSGIVAAIERKAKQVWATHKNDVLSLKKTLPSFRKNFPIVIREADYEVKKVVVDGRENYVVSLQLQTKEAGQTRFEVIIKAPDWSTQNILERILSGEYKKGAMLVTHQKKKWFCNIPYEFEAKKNSALSCDRVMGVDLGVTKAVYWAFKHTHARGFIDGAEIEAFRQRVRKRRISIQHQGKYCGEGRNGHGVARKLLPVESLQEKEANFRDTVNHRYAHHVVKQAVRYGCGVIQMEKLKGIREDNAFLANWTYHDLKTKIKNKAEEQGIAFVEVNPQYTSQRCSECGHIEKANRPNQSTFVCVKCGYGSLHKCFSCGRSQEEAGVCKCCGEATKHLTINADYNAARNLATPDIEQIIAGVMGSEDVSIKKARAKVKRTANS